MGCGPDRLNLLIPPRQSSTDSMSASKENGVSFVIRRRIFTGLIFLCVLVGLTLSLPGPGLCWDEPYYLAAASHSYLPWFRRLGDDALSREAILTSWNPVERHPPATQIWIGLVQTAAGGWLGDLLVARLAVAMLFAILAAWLFLFVARRSGNLPGFLAAASLVFIPRVLGHAHFATLDIPIALGWFAVVAVFVEVLDRPARWWPLPGIVFGLALLTKSTVLPLPALLMAWGLWSRGRRALWPCLSLALGPALLLLWPWMWVDTGDHLRSYLELVSARPSIGVYYLGRSGDCSTVPWHYPLVMTIGTTPIFIFAFGVMGSIGVVRRWKEDPVGLLMLANVVFILGIASGPGIPRYDGIRLFLPLFPFLAALAGTGFAQALKKCQSLGAVSAGAARAFSVLGVTAFALYHLVWLYVLHPFYLSDYSVCVGGPRGAGALGLETTFWLDAMDRKVIEFVNEQAPQNARVALFPYAHLARLYHEDHGTFRADLKLVNRTRSELWDVQVLICRQGMFDEEAWRLYKSGIASFERKLMDVPLCKVFVRAEGNYFFASP